MCSVASDFHGPMDCSPPGSSVHEYWRSLLKGIFVAHQAPLSMNTEDPFSKGSSQPREAKQVGSLPLYHLEASEIALVVV